MQPVTDRHFAIPFYENRGWNCGPVAVKMALEFLGGACTVEEARSLASGEAGEATMTIGLAVAAARLGLKASFYTRSLALEPSLFDSEFYKAGFTSFDREKEKGDHQIELCRQLGVGLHEQVLTLDEVLQNVTRDSVVIVLFDWNVIRGTEGKYWGHFAPLVGYDSANIAIHHSGFIQSSGEVIENAKPGMRVSRELFDKARLSEGTDVDTLVLRRE